MEVSTKVLDTIKISEEELKELIGYKGMGDLNMVTLDPYLDKEGKMCNAIKLVFEK